MMPSTALTHGGNTLRPQRIRFEPFRVVPAYTVNMGAMRGETKRRHRSTGADGPARGLPRGSHRGRHPARLRGALYRT